MGSASLASVPRITAVTSPGKSTGFGFHLRHIFADEPTSKRAACGCQKSDLDNNGRSASPPPRLFTLPTHLLNADRSDNRELAK